MDVTKATYLLSLGNPYHLGSASDKASENQFHNVAAAHNEIGTPFRIQKADNTSLKTVRDRLLTTMEVTQQAAGGSASLLTAQNLGEAGAHLQGDVSPASLRSILDDTKKDTRWAFVQSENGSITPLESAKKFHTLPNGHQALTLSRAEIANKIANEVDSNVGMDVITKVIANTKENIQNATHAIEVAGWAGKDSFLAENAKHYVNEAIESGRLISKAVSNLIPKQVEIPIVAAAGIIAGMEEASASTGDNLTKTSTFLNKATADIGGDGARAIARGDIDAGLRDFADKYVPGSDMVLRTQGAQAVIDALPKEPALLKQMQTDMKRAPIDQHLAEYKLRIMESSANSNLLEGLSASSTLTDLAERKVLLQAQWKANADTFKAAAQHHDTNWTQFKKDNPDLVIQADMHLAAKNSGHAQAFVDQMDKIIADNTAKGTPMQPIAQQLSQLTHQQHPANEPDLEQVATR